jgi:hypothetical protein
VSGWQPIETAPQQRKLIVFYRNSAGKGRCVMACYYRAHSLEMESGCEDGADYDENEDVYYAPAGWYEEHETDDPMMPLAAPPTHWMPLPEPPAEVRA